MMEEEIDLRIYVEVLLRYWMWIVGLAVGAAVVAMIISLLLPPVYEASAVVLVTEPRYHMQFDPRIGTGTIKPSYNALPTLATSDSILQKVVEAYAPSPEAQLDEWDLDTLSGIVEASSEGDPSLVVLNVTFPLPQDAAGIANAWADVLMQQGNEIYGQSQQTVVFFTEQVAQAEDDLNKAEAALIEFQSRNEASIINAQLESLLTNQTDYLAQQRTIAYLIQDVEGLRQQLAQQPSDESTSLADDLTILSLQIKAFNAEDSTPIQLQLGNNQSFSGQSMSEQIVFLDNLMATLQAKSMQIKNRLQELEPQILNLQERLQEVQAENDRLTRERNLANETYITLARKTAEARIAAQEESGILQIGSYASVPIDPTGPRKLFSVAVAGILGLALGVFVAFFIEYWQHSAKVETSKKS